ncbi:MAG TPA: insulinase family protein [Phaeodactylibacter sp.]|nr:insulinase family protein [Phaeodactylibacter sp.]
MINRSIQPPIKEISNIHVPDFQEHILDNGIPVYEVHLGTQEILKLEIVFEAGRPFEHQKLVARATAALLREGTATKKGAEIHETVDFYGGTLSVPVNLDTSNIVLYSLTKHFEKLLALLSEILTTPIFPEKELEIFKENSKRQLQLDLTKNDVVAYRILTEKIFGKEHPYGYNSSPEDYDALTRQELFHHFERNFHAGNCTIIVSGKTNAQTINLLNKYIGKNLVRKIPIQRNIIKTDFSPQKIKIDFSDSLQSAIRIGCKLFNRKHEDYAGFYVLNTLLGGYFGSRLMSNIREKKGYTYNIFSSIDPMVSDGYFYVGTEVSNDFVKPTMDNIYQEFEKLKTKPIQEEELKMVKNYLLGFFLTNLDGAFNVAELVKIMETENLPDGFFSSMVQKVKTISSEEIMELAQKYLKKENMWEVIVGE